MPEGTLVPYTKKTGSLTRDEIRAKLDELHSDFIELRGIDRTPDDDERLRKVSSEAMLYDGELTAVEALERLEQVNNLAATAAGGGGRMQRRSGGDMIINSEECQTWIRQGCPDNFAISLPGVSIDDFHSRAVISDWAVGGPPNYDTTGAGYLLPVGQPVPPVPRQAKLYLRDLMPKLTTTLAAVPYVRELNPTSDEVASAVAEGGTKPNANIAFQGAKADPSVIAATLVLSKQLFEDAPLIVQYVNQRLPYIVKFKEDAEFLLGGGTWPDITGIYNTPGLLTQGATTGETAQTIGNAFAKVENQDGMVTAVVMNPTDAWNMFTKRAAGGAGTFDAGTPFAALPLTVWGVPTYRTRAKAAGDALVGDFDRGAAVIDREMLNVQTYRERYAELNEILLVCEERVGLAVWRPDLFCSTTIS